MMVRVSIAMSIILRFQRARRKRNKELEKDSITELFQIQFSVLSFKCLNIWEIQDLSLLSIVSPRKQHSQALSCLLKIGLSYCLRPPYRSSNPRWTLLPVIFILPFNPQDDIGEQASQFLSQCFGLITTNTPNTPFTRFIDKNKTKSKVVTSHTRLTMELNKSHSSRYCSEFSLDHPMGCQAPLVPGPRSLLE